jgi:hypothetical protein
MPLSYVKRRKPVYGKIRVKGLTQRDPFSSGRQVKHTTVAGQDYHPLDLLSEQIFLPELLPAERRVKAPGRDGDKAEKHGPAGRGVPVREIKGDGYVQADVSGEVQRLA